MKDPGAKSAARNLDRLVMVALLASIVHFTDNAIRFSRFPEPAWISGPRIVIALSFAITPILLGGWWLAHRQRFRLAQLALQAYSALSLFALGHYAYPAPAPLPASIHAGIALNALTAGLLLVCSPSMLRRMRIAAHSRLPNER